MLEDGDQIGGQPDIALQAVRADLERAPVGDPRVLRELQGSTAMGDDAGPASRRRLPLGRIHRETPLTVIMDGRPSRAVAERLASPPRVAQQ